MLLITLQIFKCQQISTRQPTQLVNGCIAQAATTSGSTSSMSSPPSRAYKHDLLYQCHHTLSYQWGAAIHRIPARFSPPFKHYVRFFLCPTPVPSVSWSGPTDNARNQVLLTIHVMNPSERIRRSSPSIRSLRTEDEKDQEPYPTLPK